MGAAMGGLGAEVRYRVGGSLLTVTRGGERRVHEETLFDYLSRELARLHTDSPELPFDLNGGFVGYLGYELKADCGAAAAHEAELPDAFLLLADRIVAIDHELGQTHLLALSDGSADELAAARRLARRHAAPRSTRLPVLDEPRDARPRRSRRSSSRSAAGASTTWRTSRPASACSNPARATRSA